MRPNKSTFLESILFLPALLIRLPVVPLTLLPNIAGNGAAAVAAVFANPLPHGGEQQQQQKPITSPKDVIKTLGEDKTGDQKRERAKEGVSIPFFASLERMARLVDIAYCVGTTGISKPFSCASRCRDFPTLHLVKTWNTGILMSDSCGYIAVDHGSPADKSGPTIIVAFRGTYSITNTIIDLSTIPQEYVPYPSPDDDDDDDGEKDKCDNCTVHMGFLQSWRAAREIVLPVLKEARRTHPGYPVHLVGHSLGGSVASLAALELRLSLGWEDVTVTTFGEPRVGNKELVRYLDRAFSLIDDDDDGHDDKTEDGKRNRREKLQYRRVTHANDPVPLLPLTEWGYRSHAGEVYVAKRELPPGPEDLRLCVGDRDPECSHGAEVDDGGDWFSGLFGSLRGGKKADIEAEVEVEISDEGDDEDKKGDTTLTVTVRGFPTRLKLWQLLFAHRDYFWRLGLCVPGGDPADWGRGRYNMSESMTGVDKAGTGAETETRYPWGGDEL